MDAPTMLRLTRHGDHVVELALDRPDAMNAVSTAFSEEITSATADLARDASVRAVVVTSTHATAFCVGADLKERNGFSDAEMMDHRLVSKLAYRGVLDLPMPAIAAVEGYALGGGLEIAISCDLLVAGREATLALPEVGVGVIPGGGGTQLLTRRVGWSRAASMIFTARRLTGTEGHELGVVDELVDAGSARERALELAASIAGNSPVAVRNAKRAMRLGQGTDLAAGLEIEDGCWRATAFSRDRAEGVAAFAEKRTPQWPGG
ncbi:enoyl-CoA hydratase [Serinicoccus sp. CNJ-927]|uniref:enoyl-CoA hydratase-related protein n=1 Tax=Serinicoccus sp. CNJ-927 TaxID=1904970 RepID=UPI00095E8864|nr:enoyl-CoA hydratase-related protein [Serinicoccus sp. CNJ-927]OLT39168.1 enoyl-CoA hydratase [Serinicoccus sp. CNJ-927]